MPMNALTEAQHVPITLFATTHLEDTYAIVIQVTEKLEIFALVTFYFFVNIHL